MPLLCVAAVVMAAAVPALAQQQPAARPFVYPGMLQMRGKEALMKSIVAGIMALSVLPVFSSTARAQHMKLSEVLVFDVPDLRPDADSKAFESYVFNQVAPAWKKSAYGRDLHLLRADRGGRKGQYVLLRDQVGDLRLDLGPFVKGSGSQSEYHLLSPEKVGALPEVDILGIHYIKVRPERREAFERFVSEKLHPAVANLRPDLRLLYYKSIRGAEVGNYILVFALTNESRDKYWPGGSDSDDLGAAFKPLKALAEELGAYLVEGSYLAGDKFAAAVYESREWTDFVQVSAAAR